MVACKHTNTIVNSSESAYWIQCLDCQQQFDESQAVQLEEYKLQEYLNNDALEAMAMEEAR